jgi:hypothetical protein
LWSLSDSLQYLAVLSAIVVLVRWWGRRWLWVLLLLELRIRLLLLVGSLLILLLLLMVLLLLRTVLLLLLLMLLLLRVLLLLPVLDPQSLGVGLGFVCVSSVLCSVCWPWRGWLREWLVQLAQNYLAEINEMLAPLVQFRRQLPRL